MNAFGNVMYLLDPTGSCTAVGENAFWGLLSKQNNEISYLHDVSKLILPATTVGTGCYTNMFNGQKYITKGPIILAETITGENPFGWMFQGCSALEEAPKLYITSVPASTKIMERMFDGCVKLAKIDMRECDNITLGSSTTPNWLNDAGTSSTAESKDFYCKSSVLVGNKMMTGGSADTVPNGWWVGNN